MPFPSSPRTRSGPRRRSLLAVGSTALALAGCTAGTEDPGGRSDGQSAAERRARARAARDSEGLVERYDAVIAARPALAGLLRPLREEAARHARAFGADRRKTPSSTAPSAPPSPDSPSAAAVPGNDKDALAVLAAAERELADRRAGTLLDVPGELARLLASVAAAGAAHVYLLTEGGV
ncbi:lipoprotein [Streptomyces venetus]|uniref:Lipoprotein n=1 Tax=Streptomyces venetus TaxID=1701086 RepID=A0ABP8H1G4_9ACTN